MKKKVFVTASLFLSIAIYSQVGINTQTPKRPLDVTAKKQMERPLKDLLFPILLRPGQATDTQ